MKWENKNWLTYDLIAHPIKTKAQSSCYSGQLKNSFKQRQKKQMGPKYPH